MIAIKSHNASIQRSASEVYQHLSSPENYRSLMPDRVRSFEATATEAQLNIEGLGNLRLGFGDCIENQRIELVPLNKVPFEFNLQWNIVSTGATCTAEAVINAKLNFAMRLMAEKLLKDFLEAQVTRLEEQLNT